MSREIHEVLVKTLKSLQMEEKRIRRVRTPAGVAHFGQPIGSIIVRDLDGPDKPRRRRSPVNAQSTRRTADSGGYRTRADRATLNSLDDLKWKKQADSNYAQEAEFEGLRIKRFQRFRSSDDEPATYSYEVFAGESMLDNVPYAAQMGQDDESLKRIINTYSGFKQPKRTDRKMESLMDYWEGVYGKDWLHEGDEYGEDDWKNPTERQIMAIMESQELGIEVQTVGVGSRGGEIEMHPEVHEMINTVVRIMDGFYPGFSKVQNKFRIEARPGRAMAWNGADIEEMTGDQKFQYVFNGVGATNTYIGFNPNYFGKKSGAIGKVVGGTRNSMANGFFSGEDLDKVAKEYDITPEQLAIMNTIIHEMGHTVGRMIFGELTLPGIDRQAWSDEYKREAGELFQKYGMVEDIDFFINNFDTKYHRKNSTTPATMSRTAVTAHISKYGSTNLHEIMAETWASFLLDPRPTEFVQEFGTMMEELMITWLEEAGLDNDS